MSISHRQESSGIEAFWGFSDRQWTRSGLTLAEGVLLGRRLLASTWEPEGVLCLASHEEEFRSLAAGRCPVTVLTPAEMEHWAGFPFHRGVLVVARRPAPLTLEQFLTRQPAPQRLAIAPNLTDPENLGSLFRTALGLGWDGVAVGSLSCDPMSRRVAKVSMGAIYSHPPVVLPPGGHEVRRLFQASGWTSLALCLEPEAQILDLWARSPEGRQVLSGPVAVWVGNEYSGLSVSDRAVCQQALTIPMAPGHDSLNVAVASGIALYSLGRPRTEI